MVAIRLSRTGKKNHATYRFVVSDRRKDTLGSALDILGHYNPHTTPTTIVIDEERVKHWLSKGAKPSDTVHNLLVEKGIIKESKRQIVRLPKATATTDAKPAEGEPKPAEAGNETKPAEAA